MVEWSALGVAPDRKRIRTTDTGGLSCLRLSRDRIVLGCAVPIGGRRPTSEPRLSLLPGDFARLTIAHSAVVTAFPVEVEPAARYRIRIVACGTVVVTTKKHRSDPSCYFFPFYTAAPYLLRQGAYMARTHVAAIASAIMIGLLLLAGMVFGNHPMPPLFGARNQSIREVCIALWVFLLPSWFLLEEYWAPDADPELKRFRKGQQFARVFWTIASGSVAIIIGHTPSAVGVGPADSRQKPPTTMQQPPSKPLSPNPN